MNKRKDFIYELTGRITGKKSKVDKNGTPFLRAFAEIDDKPQVRYLTVFKDSLATEKIWKDIEEANYHKKEYVFYIANPDITNEIKKHEVIQTQNTKEREQLWADLKEDFSEIRRVFGIRHLTSKKEERQNNPEIELNEAQFIALERRKKRVREKCIKEAENKGFCLGKHTLTYGTSPEQREEKVLEAKELEEVKEEPEKEKLEQLEQKDKEVKEITQEK